MNTYLTLPRDSNQARGIAQYAIDFLAGKLGKPSEAVLKRLELFHLDSVACGISALGCSLNAPRVLRQEALRYEHVRPAAGLLGSRTRVAAEKAVLANCSAVRELDANGTNFGYNPRTGYVRGEFGHNDF